MQSTPQRFLGIASTSLLAAIALIIRVDPMLPALPQTLPHQLTESLVTEYLDTPVMQICSTNL